ncbi:MAG TPA: sensor histidine kinase [Verrucomicrobiae bacterium]
MIALSRIARVRAKHMPWLVISLVLLIIAATIAIVTLNLRRGLRNQIIQQDGMMLYAASMVPTTLTSDSNLGELERDPDIIFANLTEIVLQASEQKGVLAVQLFARDGKADGNEESLSDDELDRLRGFNTISSFKPAAVIRKKNGEMVRTPLIRALVPLRQKNQFIGAAEFILDAEKVADELQKLDRNLLKYSIRIFLLAGGIMGLSLWFAFRQLQLINRRLEERTKSLLRANHELTLAAKTSAVGAITAHLLHDLKSPLFGLQSFVSARGAADDEDWEIALSTTQRMQKMIQEIVKLLQEEKTNEQYELSIDEVLALLREKLEPECAAAGIEFVTQGSMHGSLINRDGNIILLLIANLVHNAIQAVPKGGEISVKVTDDDGNAIFDIADTGPGLPEHILSTLFTPSRSTKSGGTGLGLAISKQLANHIGAELTLKTTSKSGTIFQLRVPERMLNSELVAP